MSASTHPCHDLTSTITASPRRTPGPPWSAGPHRRRHAHNAVVTSLLCTLDRSGKWAEWQQVEPRLAGFDNLEEARKGWRRRDERCYQVVAGLTTLGSRRGGDDNDAALAVAVMLEDGVNRVAVTLSDVCEIDDVTATVWEEVKAASPHLGPKAADYLLRRARQRLARPAAGMVARIETISLEAGRDTDTARGGASHRDWVLNIADREPLIAVPDVEDPVEDLTDLLTWAQNVGVIATEEVDLLIELLSAENQGMTREEAQRIVGERHGVAMRTIRRRRDRAAARLRDAAPRYLAAIA